MAMVFEKVKSILSDHLSINESEITMELNLVKDLEMDSLDLADLIATLEDEFNIEITDDVMQGITTVSDIVEYLQALENN